MRVLLAEDDPLIARDVVAHLSRAGFNVVHEKDGEAVLFAGEHDDFAAVILDLGLPTIDGLTILKRWRSGGRDMPVIILTARGNWDERVTPSADQRSGDANVGKIIGETIRMLKHTEAGERLSWQTDIKDGLTLPIDPHDFRELAGNLLENAAKWAKSRVSVSTVEQAERTSLVIEDDGPGVSSDRLPDLPRRGVRLDRLKPGSGLGLAIVSEIAAVYDLTLNLQNRSDGGFRAEVVFPHLSSWET